MPTLLIVDDEPNVCYSLERSLRSDELAVLTARTAKQALEVVSQQRLDAVIMDVRLPDLSGLDAFARIHELDARLPVIVITAYASTETAIEAMKRGAFEYLLKPVDLHQVRDLVAQAVALSHARHVPAVFGPAESVEGEVDRIVGQTPAMQEVYKAIGRVAPQDMTVLILGASGTGKELVARAIYHHSRRCGKPFLAINCAAIPESLLESELFGHERGAFTGADRKRIGKFEQTHGGTVFLDEIGDMTSATQAKVLRLLQDQRFERLGGNETIQSDVRLIAATNQDLEQLVAAGKFRKDLFYRLKVFAIRLPPLAERLDDIPLLIEHFLRLYSRELKKQVFAASPEALQLLIDYPWPGNVRELQSVIKYGLLHATGDRLTPDCLPDSVRKPLAAGPLVQAGADKLELAQMVRDLLREHQSDLYEKLTREFDRVVLYEVLRHVRNNQVRASEILGISRTTLRAKLRALESMVEKPVLSESAQSVQKLDSR
jgi:two-component system nitrogen regulation response regulator GlnG